MKLTLDEIRELRTLYQANIKVAELTRRYKVSPSTVNYHTRNLTRLNLGRVAAAISLLDEAA